MSTSRVSLLARVPRCGRRLAAPLVVLLALLAIGCKSTVSTEVYCYRVTGATVHAVDVGMRVAGDLYSAGAISDAQKAALISAHDIYRPAAQAAVAGCKAVGSQKDADRMITQIKIAADKVLEALVKAGVIK